MFIKVWRKSLVFSTQKVKLHLTTVEEEQTSKNKKIFDFVILWFSYAGTFCIGLN